MPRKKVICSELSIRTLGKRELLGNKKIVTGNKSRKFQYDPHKLHKSQTGNSMDLPDQKIKHFTIDCHKSAGKKGGVIVSPQISYTGHVLPTNALNYTENKNAHRIQHTILSLWV
jgi:hypothetical protein